MVATTVTGASIKVVINAEMSAAPDFGTLAHTLPYEKRLAFTDGAGANQINTFWQDQRTIVASGTDDIDFAGGIADAFGNTLTLTKWKGLFIYAAAANTNNVLIGGDAAALVGWVGNANDVISVQPGGMFCLVNPNSAGYVVTGTTADILQIANSSSGTPVTYDIILFGCE